MPKIWRVYSGADGQSHVEEMPLAMKPFTDTEGAHGEGTAVQPAAGIVFRVSPPGYVLDWHCAPRRQYSITLSGQAEIQVGDPVQQFLPPGLAARRPRRSPVARPRRRPLLRRSGSTTHGQTSLPP